jgi:ubiquinone/menaquinone biosynthesis C-methylase UbiE
MRITYRKLGIKEYWASRWDDIPADLPMENTNAYPLKYAEMTIKDQTGKILEAGCGAGRILRYYHNKGMNIVGIDFIDIAIEKLKIADVSLSVEVGDIMALQFDDQCFKYILSFGLYHNLEKGLDLAIQETYRVLENGGAVCASFRADNIQTRLTDWLANKHSKKNTQQEEGSREEFHKMNLTRSEFENSFRKAGFNIEYTTPVENMPLLYKFALFRAAGHKVFDENRARSEGYRLSWVGQKLQNFLMRFFPDQFCNIYVLIANKL